MNVIGIIAEYNPFHNGHVYLLEKIKEMYPDSLIILVLNGLFLQRGEFSILTKEDKTKIALDHNIDIVLELPTFYGTQSADIFAEAALHILNKFKVETIIFGSEANNPNILKEIATIQLNDQNYQTNVKTYLKQGFNYPTSLAKALNLDFNFLPNDLLGISYAKAILKNNYPINVETIKRTNDYKDTTSNNGIISATNIRNKLKNNEDITPFLPKNITNFININEDKYLTILKYKILTHPNLNQFLDVDEGLEHLLKKEIKTSQNLDEFIKKIKSKRYTYNKLNRLFIHILLELNKNINLQIDYIHILGFNKKGQEYLNSLKENLNLNINKNSYLYHFELQTSLIYDLINQTNTYNFELKNKPIIKN
ncbi:MAG: nucleotidyltransferase [Firmicutes bacterium]|nr:nucleotidyltransferase [Bacillota bacterium]